MNIHLDDPALKEHKPPQECPFCGSSKISRWGQEKRGILDTHPVEATIIRYLCDNCSRTFRYYPLGVDRSPISMRIRRLAALIYLLDLSCRDVVELFKDLGITLNRMTVWREGQKLLQMLDGNNGKQKTTRKFTLLKDNHPKAYSLGCVVLALSTSLGNSTVLGTLDAPDAKSVIDWLKPLFKNLDIKVSVLETQELKLFDHFYEH